MKTKNKSVFLPPGVQMRLFDGIGTCPRQLPVAAVEKIEALWATRNQAPEEQLAAIDKQMEEIAVAAATPDAMAVSRAINAKRSSIQGAIDRREDRGE